MSVGTERMRLSGLLPEIVQLGWWCSCKSAAWLLFYSLIAAVMLGVFYDARLYLGIGADGRTIYPEHEVPACWSAGSDPDSDWRASGRLDSELRRSLQQATIGPDEVLGRSLAPPIHTTSNG